MGMALIIDGPTKELEHVVHYLSMCILHRVTYLLPETVSPPDLREALITEPPFHACRICPFQFRFELQ